MQPRPARPPKQAPRSTYILISVTGFLLSLFCIYYYLHDIQGKVAEQTGQQAFYLILILFGISASAIIFGVMNSIGVMKGEYSGTRYYLTGPVVGVVLVVVGGFCLPKVTSRRPLSVRVTNDQHLPVVGGKVTLYFAQYTRDQIIDNAGLAVFSDISSDDLHGKIGFDISSDGYTRMTFDTLLSVPAPIEVVLARSKVIHISGKVLDANDMPIRDVTIMVDGSRFYGKTITDGSYAFDIVDYSIGDEIDLVSSNKAYRDKTQSVKLVKQDMNVDFTIAPLR